MAFKKDPNAVLDYTFDWGPYLTPLADSIVSVVWLPEEGLTVSSMAHTATTATAFVSGGVLDSTQNVTCRITTLGGRTDDRSISLKITNR